MEDLRDTTHTRHYELYRKDRLQQVQALNSIYTIIFTLVLGYLIYIVGKEEFFNYSRFIIFSIDGIFRQ